MSQKQTLIKKSSWGGARPGAGRPRKNQTAFSVGSFTGALRSAQRGYVYYPNLDARWEVDGYSRVELIRRARWLYNNIGFATHLIDSIANFVCDTGMTIHARTSDEDWNREAEDWFDRMYGNVPWAFDRSGAVNFYDAQTLIVRAILTDGDFFAQFIKSQAGRAMVRFIGAESIGNTGISYNNGPQGSNEGWNDGVLTDEYNKPIRYRVTKDLYKGEYEEVSADDILHFRRIRRWGHVREVSALHAAVNHLVDINDILGYTKTSFKLASQVGFLITSPDETLGLGAAIHKLTTQDGNTVNVETTFNSSGNMVLKPGEKVEMLDNKHPGSNFKEFMDFLIRDISLGCGITPELAYNIVQTGGANLRAVLQKDQIFFRQFQNIIAGQFCSPFWKYAIWHELESGRLRWPKNRDEWFRHEVIYPRNITVDFGRDGKLLSQLVTDGQLSRKRYFAMQGLDEETEDRDIIQSAIRRRKMLAEAAAASGVDLDFDDVWPPTMSQAKEIAPAPNPDNSPGGEDEEPPQQPNNPIAKQ